MVDEVRLSTATAAVDRARAEPEAKVKREPDPPEIITVDLSLSEVIDTVLANLQAADEVDHSQRVAALREQVSSQQYKVDYADLANKLIGEYSITQ